MPVQILATLCLFALMFSACTTRPRKFGASCGANAECESGRCQANLCAAFCQSSDECGDNLCVDNTCVPATSVVCADAAACVAFLPAGSCRSAICTAGHCEQVAKDGQSCTIGKCSGLCTAKACKPTEKSCNDNNLCTSDTCDPQSGCSHTAKDGPCTDHDLCTGDLLCKDTECLGDVCANGVCKGGDVRLCQPPVCNTVLCQPAEGCVFTPRADGLPCSVANACITGGKCSSGKCVGSALSCDDNNACTLDYCDVVSGCKNVPRSGSCGDSKGCVDLVCDSGKCVAHPTVCSDGNPCTADACDPTLNSCSFKVLANGAACSADGCLTSASCVFGVCNGKAKLCDDGNPCTVDTCVPDSGSCNSTLDISICDDKNPCTYDACNLSGCLHGPNATACDDGKACTSGDKCSGGSCIGVVTNPSAKEDCATVGIDDNCNGQTDEGCGPLNAVGCGVDGYSCGGGKGTCSNGHCFSVDAKGYQWTLVPAGTFWMGCNAALDGGCQADEQPQHLVDMSAYWLGVYEVSAANYTACFANSYAGCTTPLTGQYSTWNVAGKEQHPVNGVDWAQARAYCQWIGGDLPTEAQWEKGARGVCDAQSGNDCAATALTYAWGNDAPVCGKHAVFNDFPPGKSGIIKTCGGPPTTYLIGSGSVQGASPYGAYDMAGNVAEWTLDYWDPKFFGSVQATLKDPVKGVNDSSYGRVFRGHSFVDVPQWMRVSLRLPNLPNAPTYSIGMRCAKAYQQL